MNKFQIKKNIYQSYKKVLTIAEIGCNHNNDFNICKKLIIHAKKSGFDAVKFQMFKADLLVENKTKGHKLLSKYELSELWIKKISIFCKKIDILFFCSPFYLDAVKILKKYKCDALKIASPEIKNLALIKKVLNANLPTIISTGDSSFKEINEVTKLIKNSDKKKIAFLHCVSEYPAQVKNLNLNNIPLMKSKLPNHAIGFSDHSTGVLGSLFAVSSGACIIEKHVTLDRKMKGPDHFFAIEPNEMSILIKDINNFLLSLGNKNKTRLRDENTIHIKIFSSKKIRKNEKIDENKLKLLRSFSKQGIDGKDYFKVIKKFAKKDIPMNKRLSFKSLKNKI